MNSTVNIAGTCEVRAAQSRRERKINRKKNELLARPCVSTSFAYRLSPAAVWSFSVSQRAPPFEFPAERTLGLNYPIDKWINKKGSGTGHNMQMRCRWKRASPIWMAKQKTKTIFFFGRPFHSKTNLSTPKVPPVGLAWNHPVRIKRKLWYVHVELRGRLNLERRCLTSRNIQAVRGRYTTNAVGNTIFRPE